eukprot:m.42791 g.42791  ORF g.42791 m.42791 type:complete len:83 (+) comp46556_c0_seq2:635-883(+)
MQTGYTYDGKANDMLSVPFQNRLDRVLFSSNAFKPAQIQLLGRTKIEGKWCERQVRKQTKTVALFPSDHFGVLATFELVDDR